MGESDLDIKAFRDRHGLSQSQLAEMLPVSLRTLQDWENAKGKGKPPLYLGRALSGLVVELKGGLDKLVHRAVELRVPELRKDIAFAVAVAARGEEAPALAVEAYDPEEDEWEDIGEQWNELVGEMVETQKHYRIPNKFRMKPKRSGG